MRISLVALTIATLSVLAGSVSPALADSRHVANGTISSIGANSLTVRVGTQDMKFAVNSKTIVEAKGGSTKSARAVAAGKQGPHLDELLSAGQSVAVTYRSTAGTPYASNIKAMPRAPASTGDASLKSDGVVKAMGTDWITINGRAGGGSSFEQTFKVSGATKVFAKGAGTAAAAKGGRARLADLVFAGDHVTVTYHDQGDSLIASGVRVTLKATE